MPLIRKRGGFASWISRNLTDTAILALSIVALSIVALSTIGASNGLGQDKPASQTVIAGDLFQFPPTTPDGILEAATMTRDLNRQDDARLFIRKLLELQLSDAEWRALRRRAGAGPFLELSADAKLLPEARELLHAVNAASKPQPLTESELQELIQALATPGEAATEAAVTLIANGGASAAALLAADAGSPAGKVAAQLLENHARDMRFGLLEQLPLADTAGQLRILKLLAGTADPNIAPRLLRWQFGPEVESTLRTQAAMAVAKLSQGGLTVGSSAEAAEVLTQLGTRLLKAATARFSRMHGAVVDEASKSQDLQAELLNEASLCLTDAVALDEANRRAAAILLVARSAAADPSMTAATTVAAGQPVAELSNALQIAVEIGADNAAVELLRGLQASDYSAITTETGDHVAKALREAVNSPDPRVRFLASHIAINVTHSEISDSAVQRTLTSVRDGGLKPEAVVVDSNNQSLRNLDVALEDAGFIVAPRQTGQDGFDAAVGQMNCELILIDAEAAGWPLATTLANLRSDARTRYAPIVVIGPDRFARRVSRLGETHAGVWFLSEPVAGETLALKLASLNLPPHVLSPEDRAVMKQQLSGSVK